VFYGILISLSGGLLVLALSSLSRNSRYIALFWLGSWFVSSITASALEDAYHEQRAREDYIQRTHVSPEVPVPRSYRFRPPEGFQEKMLEARKTDWRPLVSYTDNLSRLRGELLGTDKAWQKLANMHPPYDRARFLMTFSGYTYPWYWSAGVLAGLCGLSICVLHFQVKSLDRLK